MFLSTYCSVNNIEFALNILGSSTFDLFRHIAKIHGKIAMEKFGNPTRKKLLTRRNSILGSGISLHPSYRNNSIGVVSTSSSLSSDDNCHDDLHSVGEEDSTPFTVSGIYTFLMHKTHYKIYIHFYFHKN